MKYLLAIIFCIIFFGFGCQEEKVIQVVKKATIVGNWQRLSSKDNSHPIERHEAALVKVDSLIILLGGRGMKPVSIYNIANQQWTVGAKPPIELHHFQPVIFNKRVFIIGALTGPYPGEQPVPDIYIYDPLADTWEKGDPIPENRQRGSAGVVIIDDTIYITCGIKNGHIGDHKKWLDKYEPKTGKWTVLPDAPRARDHFQSVAAEGKIYVLAGRLSKAPKEVFKHPVKEIDIYDISKKKWTTSKSTIPTLRAGNIATLLQQEILVIGGESDSQKLAHDEVEAFHIVDHSWRNYPSLLQGRHGTGVVQVEDKLIIASGCGKQGGEPELNTMEAFLPNKKKAAPFILYQPKTLVTIDSTQFKINGELTYPKRFWQDKRIEGLLLNARLVQGIFDDTNPETRKKWKYPRNTHFNAYRNTREFVAAIPSWKEKGLLAFSLNMQGGSPMGYGNKDWINTPYDSLGNLKKDYLIRLDQILQKADELEMVVILGLFYFGQDQHLKDEAAVIAAVDNTINWLHTMKYRNVLIEINNECDSPAYDHEILREERVHELMRNVKDNVQNDYRYLVSTSFEGHVIPTDNVIKHSDFLLLHGNGVNEPFKISEMVETTRNVAVYRPMPILFNEDDHYVFDRPKNNFKAALETYASWGYFDYRRKGEGFSNGFQSIPVDWKISSPRKKWFFNYLEEITLTPLDSTIVN